MKRKQTFALAGVTLAMLVGAALPASAQFGMNQEKIEFMVDVSEDMGRYVEHRTAPGEDPLRGSFFVTEGNIYPAGTIPGAGHEFDPNAPGSMGRWFCKGVFLVRGSELDKTPLALLTDQILLLPDDKQSIVTAGTEGNGVAMRTVIGGTGPYAGYVGEQRQEFLGFNKTGGVNLRITITLRKASR
ncbi:MAG: hypothetical protein SFV51_01085 [Bryobacteraceae bacterium]|nr:hypothetical protein [Bryobacteraceae bacterium]